MYRCPFFNTHHAPVGAWSSLTFGAPGVGMSIDFQDPGIKRTGLLMAGSATVHGLNAIGFVDIPKENGVDLTAEGNKEAADPKVMQMLATYGIYSEDEIARTLTPSKDIFLAGNISFTTYTPYDKLPDPQKEEIPAIFCLPGILMEVTVDNTEGDMPCTAFLGAMLYDMKKAYTFEGDGLCGIRYRDDWAFLAKSDDTFVVRGFDAPLHLMKGQSKIQQNGPSFICTIVPAGQKKTLTCCWSVYATIGSNGARRTYYYYNRFFKNVYEGGKAILDNAEQIRAISESVDNELLHEGQDEARVALFNQAVRGYYASTQLLEDENGHIRWNVGEGAYVWRNTMDLCADHITWELRRNPWIVRCLMDEYIEDYSYTDTVTFPGMSGEYPGGISFTHDMGCYFSYSKHGYSEYECANDSPKGFYFYMTTEELLNGIYCFAGYVLKTFDTVWLKKHSSLLPKLMTSLENRDGATEEQRNGILKASSTRGGTCGLESTTYDALDHSLLEAAGNIYVFIKTWCSLILLEKCCDLAGDKETAERAKIMLEKCRVSSELFKSEEHPWLKANAYQDIPGAVAAAVEPLAVLHMLGVLDTDTEPILTEVLRNHSKACLEKGICWDSLSGGLRLSSTSRNTWPSKSVLTIYVNENVLDLTMPEGLVQEVINWAQVSARDLTIADQIHCDTRDVVGAPYYPRIVTAALWL